MDRLQSRICALRAPAIVFHAISTVFWLTPCGTQPAFAQANPAASAVACPSPDATKKTRTVPVAGRSELQVNLYCGRFPVTDEGAPPSASTTASDVKIALSAISAAGRIGLPMPTATTGGEANTPKAGTVLNPLGVQAVTGAKTIESLQPVANYQAVLHIAGACLLVLGTALIGWTVVKCRSSGLMFRRYWGGFGGEGTGWQASPGVVGFLAGTLLLLIGAGMMVGPQQALDSVPKIVGAAATTTTPTTAK